MIKSRETDIVSSRLTKPVVMVATSRRPVGVAVRTTSLPSNDSRKGEYTMGECMMGDYMKGDVSAASLQTIIDQSQRQFYILSL